MKFRAVIVTVMLAAFAAVCSAQQVPPQPQMPMQPLGNGPVVHTGAGSLQGTLSPNGKVAIFKGIPFAAPPVGNLRWAPPAPVQPWNGVRSATAFGASCMQSEHTADMLPWTMEYLDQNRTSEDCLYLNVWTPKVSPTEKLPVVVFIHGGAFTEGSGAVPIYDGTHLAEKGLVIVTINYRLGIFGFFAHPELTAESPHHSSGNYGLMDQIAALAWVQENISNFGGDPGRVMIWGQSAGAFSVKALLNSPIAVGLFQRAMADSGIGSSGIPQPTLAAAEQSGTQFAATHNAANLAALRAIPADQLLAQPGQPAMRLDVIQDGWVLPSAAQTATAKKPISNVSVITGYQANDGMLFSPPLHAMSDYTALLKRMYGEFAPEFEKLYPAKDLEEAKKMLIESTRDRERVSMFLWAVQREQDTDRPVFTYYFDRAIPWPQHPEFGAFHSGELPYFFLNLSLMNRPWTAADRILARDCAQYLKNFASTGNPNGAQDPKAPPSGLPQWDGVHAESPSIMELGVHRGSMPLASKARIEFWTRYFNSDASKNAPPF